MLSGRDEFVKKHLSTRESQSGFSDAINGMVKSGIIKNSEDDNGFLLKQNYLTDEMKAVYVAGENLFQAVVDISSITSFEDLFFKIYKASSTLTIELLSAFDLMIIMFDTETEFVEDSTDDSLRYIVSLYQISATK